MAQIDTYLQIAINSHASDIHFSSGEPIRMRIDGELIPVDQNVLQAQQLQHMLFELLKDSEKQKFLERMNLDKNYSLKGANSFRVNMFMTRKGIAAVLRAIPTVIPSLEQLGFPEILCAMAELGKGLVLVTGPTGSGKSTTLAAMVDHINNTSQSHIITAEDPIEFIHQSKRSLINQREIGSSCPSFADALKFSLREDPDVILVGEMRDLETISLALTAAETGHLVFGTLHTRGAVSSIDRIIDCFPSEQQAMIRTMLAESLKAVVSQVLLKKSAGKGRVAAYEIMIVNHAISNLIREGKTFQIPSAIQTGRKEGMILLDQKIRDLVNEGIVSQEEAEAYVESASALLGMKKNRSQHRQDMSPIISANKTHSLAGNKPVSSPWSPVGRVSGPPPMGSGPPPIIPGTPSMVSAPPKRPGTFTPQPLIPGEETNAAFKLPDSMVASNKPQPFKVSPPTQKGAINPGNKIEEPTLQDQEEMDNKSKSLFPAFKKKVG